MACKESESNRTEPRALLQQREERRAMFDKQQEEINARAGQAGNDGQAEEPLKATEDVGSPLLAKKLFFARTPRSASPTRERVRKIVLSV